MLADDLGAEAVVRLALDELEAGALVDPVRSLQHVLGPKRYLLVAALASEPQALVHELRPEPRSARPRFDQQQPELRGPVVLSHAQDGTGAHASDLGDPGGLALGVVRCREVGDDPRDEGLEVLVEAELVGVQRAVTLDDPAVVAAGRRA